MRKVWRCMYMRDGFGVVVFHKWWSRTYYVYLVEGTKEGFKYANVSIDFFAKASVAFGKKEYIKLLNYLYENIKKEPELSVHDSYWTKRYGYIPTLEDLHDERKQMMEEIVNNPTDLLSFERRLKNISKDIRIKAIIDDYLKGDSILMIKKNHNISSGLIYYYLSKIGIYERRYNK